MRSKPNIILFSHNLHLSPYLSLIYLSMDNSDPKYGGDRLRLFNVDEPFTLPLTEFEEKWKEVDNVWCQTGKTERSKRHPDGWTKTYDCRFRKRQKSSAKDPNVPVNKKRKTSIHEPDLCNAMITVTHRDGSVTIRKTHPGGPSHTHGLRESDMRKTPSKIVNFLEEELKKKYRAPAVREVARDGFKNEQLGSEFITTKKILNVQHRIHGGLETQYLPAGTLDDDMDEAIKWLISNEYRTHQFTAGDKRGFAFAKENSLKALQRGGHLVLMDSTHKTTKYDWKLYTLLIRNEYGSWLPGGHFYVSGEDKHIVKAGLQQLKLWASNWQPRYFLIDQSAIEENAIKSTFRGIEAGEQNVDIYYCTWHLRQTLERKIGSYGESYNLMLQAMYKITRQGCEQVVQQAIEKLPVQSQYLQRQWLPSSSRWGMWNRQHSPLLLQTTATSALESYHSVLKSKGKSNFGFVGSCKIIDSVDNDYFNRADAVKQEFWTKSVSEASTYQFLKGFPYPIQQLILGEFRGFEQRVADGEGIPDLQTPECHCQFFRKYLLPCKHIFHRDIAKDFLTDDNWRNFQAMFNECGLDVYQTRVTFVEPVQEDPVEAEIEHHRLQFYAAQESQREHWFQLEDAFRKNMDATPMHNLIVQMNHHQ